MSLEARRWGSRTSSQVRFTLAVIRSSRMSPVAFAIIKALIFFLPAIFMAARTWARSSAVQLTIIFEGAHGSPLGVFAGDITNYKIKHIHIGIDAEQFRKR